MKLILDQVYLFNSEFLNGFKMSRRINFKNNKYFRRKKLGKKKLILD